MSKNEKKQKPAEKASAEKKKAAEKEAVKAEETAEEAAAIPQEPEAEMSAADSPDNDDAETANETADEAAEEDLSSITDGGVIEAGEAGESAAAVSEDESLMDLLRDKMAPLFTFGSKLSEVLKRMGLPEMLLIRFITVFFFYSAVNASVSKKKEIYAVSKWRDYIPQVNMTTTVLLMVSSFLILSFIYYIINRKKTVFDQILAIAAILYFDYIMLWRAADFNLSFSMMMVTCVLVYYILNTMKSTRTLNSVPWWLCGIVVFIMAGFVTWFLSITTCARHQNFGSAAHDFGLFVQMYHSLAENGTAVSSVERDTLMSHFLIHASYIFYALVPVFKLFPKPETLLISQAVLAMGGVIPFFLIAKRHKMKGFPLIFICLSYVFCIGLTASCYYEFHENAFLPTVIMWLLWAVDGKKYIPFYIFSFLTCIVKEDAPLYVVSIALYMVFEHRTKKSTIHGLIVAAASLFYMFYITAWLTKHGDGQMMMSTRFSILMLDETRGLKEVIKNVLIDPAYLISLLIKDDTRIFFFQVMIPFLFIPFFTKKIHRFLLMIPFIVMNLVIGAGYGYAANVSFQYIFGPSTILIYLCFINVMDMNTRNKQNVPILLGCAAMIMTVGTVAQNISYYISHKDNEEYFHSVDELLDRIPKDASVGCDTFLIPHVADHKEAYIFDSYDIAEDGTLYTPEKFNFIVIPVLSDMHDVWASTLRNNSYTLYDSLDGRYEVYMSPTYIPQS